MSAKILVTGSAGFIGGYLVEDPCSHATALQGSLKPCANPSLYDPLSGEYSEKFHPKGNADSF